jgi:ribose transport system permease protein
VSLIGVLLLQVIKNVINQIGTLDSDWQSVVSGTILLVVVTLQRYLTRADRR